MDRTKKQTGGQAFPVPAGDPGMYNAGMTLRDYFAAAAMQGLMAGHPKEVGKRDQGAAIAYQWADAMLEARGK